MKPLKSYKTTGAKRAELLLLKLLFLLLLILLNISLIFAQFGRIKGTVTDKKTGEAIPMANVTVLQQKCVVTGTMTDFDGKYTLILEPGGYDLKVAYMGYETSEIKDVRVSDQKYTFIDFQLEASVAELEEVEVIEYKVPLIQKDNTETGGTISFYGNSAPTGRRSKTKVTTVTGIYSEDGKIGTFRGSRSTGNVVFVDGIKVRGASDLPESAIKDISVKTSGINNPETTEETASDISSHGILTAGEIRDYNKWELWKDIPETDLGAYRKTWNMFPVNRYSVQVNTHENIPVIDCPVQLISSEGNVVWSSRTDNTGKAELWAVLFNIDSHKKEEYDIRIIHDTGVYAIEQAIPFHSGINTMEIETECDIPDVVDLQFVVDATGSMSDEINYLKADLRNIIKMVKEKNPDLNIRLGSLFYRCKDNSYVTRRSAFSEDITNTVKFINRQSAGEEETEAVEVALDEAVNKFNWSDNAKARIMFLILDEAPGSNADILKKLHEGIKKASEKGIRVIPVVASGMSFSADKSLEYLMRCIALATNGTYVFLTDHSGVGGSHTAPTTDKFDVTLLNDILIRLIYEYTYSTTCEKDIKVDEEEIKDTMFVNNDIANNTDAEHKPGDKKTNSKNKKSRSKKQELSESETYPANENEENKNSVEEQWKSGKDNIKYYPNPTSGILHVETTAKIKEVFLADISGKLIERHVINDDQRLELNLENYPAGIYYVKCLSDEKWLSGKIILTH